MQTGSAGIVQTGAASLQPDMKGGQGSVQQSYGKLFLVSPHAGTAAGGGKQVLVHIQQIQWFFKCRSSSTFIIGLVLTSSTFIIGFG